MAADRSQRLAEQLRALALDESAPPSTEDWRRFLTSVDRAYQDAERDRRHLQRSLDVLGRETRALTVKLETERERMGLIFGIAPVGMIRTEIAGRISMVNPPLQRMLGFSEAELLAIDPIDLVHPEDRARAAESLAALRAGAGDASYTGERRFLHKNGATVLVNIAVVVARDADGHPLFTIGVVEDVSERTRLEIDLRHAQKLESVGRLAAGVAHEINTPIQFIGDNTNFLQSAFADLLQLCQTYGGAIERLGDAIPAHEATSLRAAEEAADLAYVREHAGSAFAATLEGVERVAKIVKAMKSFAHPDQPQKTAADINLALRNTLTVGFNEVKYVADVETDFDDIGPVECHLGDLNQVFLNLLVNAAHAIADVVGDSGAKGKIAIRTRREKNAVVIALSDTGTGIPEAIRHRIFDPFFTTKEVGRGTGQGLAISRSVIEKHGGTLTFETETGRGTTFFVRLPVGSSGGRERGAASSHLDSVGAPGQSSERAAG